MFFSIMATPMVSLAVEGEYPEPYFTIEGEYPEPYFTDEDEYPELSLAIEGEYPEPSQAVINEAILELPIAMFSVHGTLMDRGAIVQEVSNGVFLAWRFFPVEVTGTSDTDEYRGLVGNNFVIYRNLVRITETPITDSTNYIDRDGNAGDVYVIVTVSPIGVYLSRTEEIVARPQSATAGDYLSIPLIRPERVAVPHWDLLGETQWAYYEQDIVMVGDLDGNGQLDFVVVWQTDNPDVIQPGFNGPVIYQAYRLDGTLMWEVSTGINVRPGQHYGQPILYDLDGDGIAELGIKTAPGAKWRTVISHEAGSAPVFTEWTYITLSDESIALGVTNQDDFVMRDRLFWNAAQLIINPTDGPNGMANNQITPDRLAAASPQQIADAIAMIERGEFFQMMEDFFYGWNSHPEVTTRSYWGNLTGEVPLTWLPNENQAEVSGVSVGWWVSPPQVMMGMHDNTHSYDLGNGIAMTATANGRSVSYLAPVTNLAVAARRQAPGWTPETFELLNNLPKCPVEFRRMEITREIANALTWQFFQFMFSRAAANYDANNRVIPLGMIGDHPEYFTIFAGQTGAELATIPYVAPRGAIGESFIGQGGSILWNDYTFHPNTEPMNRSERHTGAVAYLDGPLGTASAIQGRGLYSSIFIQRYDWDGENLTGSIFATTGHEVMNNPFNFRANYLDGTSQNNIHGSPGRFEYPAFEPNNVLAMTTGMRLSQAAIDRLNAGDPGNLAASWTCSGHTSFTIFDIDGYGYDALSNGGVVINADGTIRWVATYRQQTNADIIWYNDIVGGTIIGNRPPSGNWVTAGKGDAMHVGFMTPDQDRPVLFGVTQGGVMHEWLFDFDTGELLYVAQGGTATTWASGGGVLRAIVGDFTDDFGWIGYTGTRLQRPGMWIRGSRLMSDGSESPRTNPFLGSPTPAHGSLTNMSINWRPDFSTQIIHGRNTGAVANNGEAITTPHTADAVGPLISHGGNRVTNIFFDVSILATRVPDHVPTFAVPYNIGIGGTSNIGTGGIPNHNNEHPDGFRAVLVTEGTRKQGGTKGYPSLVADVFGDYREELILSAGTRTDNQELRIYFNTEESEHKMVTLLACRRYRAEVARQQTGYTDPSYTSFYMGSDMIFANAWAMFEQQMRNNPNAFLDLTEVEFNGTSPNALGRLLEEYNVVLSTRGNLGIFANHSPFVIPAGRTLTVTTTLNISGNAELIVEGTLVVAEGGRINNQGSSGGTIRVATGGNLVNNGWVENVTNSTFANNGTITNNGRFEVRAGVIFYDQGTVTGTPPNVNRNATVIE